jgi:hypothetical protein
MKHKIILVLLLLLCCRCTKVQQLFDVINQQVQAQPNDNNLTMYQMASNNFAIPSTASGINALKEEVIKPNINLSQVGLVMKDKQNNQLNEVRDKLLEVKAFNMKLNKLLMSNDKLEEKKSKFSEEIKSLVKDGYKTFDTKINKAVLKNENFQKFKSDLSNKLDEINMVETKLTKINDNEKARLDYLTNIKQVNLNEIKATDSNINNIKANEFDFGIIKGGSYFIDMDKDKSIVYEDNKLPIKTLVEFHRAVKTIKSICGEDFNKCNYLDQKTIEQETLQQTTLLAEIKHLTQIIDKLKE